MGAGHDHPHHGHDHAPHGAARHDRAFAIGIALNLAFVAVEAGVGWQVGSLALLADAGHNLGDVAGLVLAWAAVAAGRLAPGPRHTYGWKRASIVAALFNALLLIFAMGSLGWEAVGRLGTPQPVPGLTVMLVAGAGIVVNGGTALLFLAGRHDDLNVRGAFLHMLADAALSAGVVLAGALTLAFGWLWIDPATSLAIAALILWSAWRLLRQSLHLLFDGVPDHIDAAAVRDSLATLPGVARVHDLHVWAMGGNEVALTAHLVMPQAPADDAFLRAASLLLRERFGIVHVTLQTVREPFAAGCDAPRAQ